MKKELVGSVYMTTDYDQFKNIVGNRVVKKDNSYKQLLQEMSKIGQAEPILVTKDYYVINGQHRLEVAKDLNIPVIFYISNLDATPEVIGSVNRTKKMWDVMSTARLFEGQGKKDYSIFLDYREKYNFMPTQVMSLLRTGKAHKSFATIRDEFNSGKFVATHKKAAYEFGDYVLLLEKEANSNVFRNQYFLVALHNAYSIKGFDKKLFLSQCVKYRFMLDKRANNSQSQHLIHEIYNNKLNKDLKINLRPI